MWLWVIVFVLFGCVCFDLCFGLFVLAGGEIGVCNGLLLALVVIVCCLYV